MPAPAVYIIAALSAVVAVVAFKEFVYEPHVAPKIEAWAEAFLENRRRRRHRLTAAPVPQYTTQDGRDENRARRSGSDGERGEMPVELEQLVTQEVNEWRGSPNGSGLRHRRTAGMMDESNTFIPYSTLSPTHVLFDSSAPSSPVSPLERPSLPSSPRSIGEHSVSASPSTSVHSLSGRHQTPQVAFRVTSPRLPTPISNYSDPSSRALTPNITDIGSSVSSGSSKASTPGASDINIPASMYNTAMMDTSELGHGATVLANPTSRSHSPFSDVYSVETHSSGSTSPDVRSPNIGSDFDLPSDDDYDVLSPRSGMFSPGSAQEVLSPHFGMLDAGGGHEDVSDARSQQGSEASWASVGRRTPEF
ncbi:hypothetical protein BKA93DRAFT_926731 [Sparassis latifolia]|uniref:Transmembrane protein n=1 Tax=Sparassis crispa TaxID=139825 RepID=A0A401GDG2_9APHY|nr:hypothetical protein SCP_0214100 [Sparassis crispa]GBE80200.1 hypothetical protein SCP_0214100 [Sparassis crispa]